MDHPGPYVLTGSDLSGKTIEVGMFDNERDLRIYVARHIGPNVVYTVWTPSLNEVINAARVIGITFAPK